MRQSRQFMAEAPVPPAPSPQRLRLVQITTVVILIAAFAATVILLFDPERRAQVEALLESPIGLFVLFFLSALSNATLILPVPGLALTVLAATIANPLIVGIVAGAGQAVGEMTGYLAGYSGQELIDNSPRYERLAGWMRRYGALTIFVLALIPNPIFDLAGIIAGALRMPWWLYLISAGAGKIIKNILLAYSASFGIDWLLTIYGR
jgi:membrane protein YqaA with SNARE-associated domain